MVAYYYLFSGGMRQESLTYSRLEIPLLLFGFTARVWILEPCGPTAPELVAQGARNETDLGEGALLADGILLFNSEIPLPPACRCEM